MKRKRIPKKGTNDVLSSEFKAKKIESTPDEMAGEQTNEQTLNTWEMKQDSPEELTDTEESQIAESDESYTGSDRENPAYKFI